MCYVGKTRQHLQVRFKEHLKKGPVKAHLEKCVGSFALENIDILGSTSRGEMHLLTLEALWIREVEPYSVISICNFVHTSKELYIFM